MPHCSCRSEVGAEVARAQSGQQGRQCSSKQEQEQGRYGEEKHPHVKSEHLLIYA